MCLCVLINVHLHTYIDTHTHTYTHTDTHTHTHTQTDRQTHTHTETHRQTHTHTETHTHRHTHSHTDRQTDTHTQTDRHPFVYVFTGRSVLLEQPRKTGVKVISHMLTSHGGEIFIHTIPTARSILEDPPSISEGCGGRVTDYRITVSQTGCQTVPFKSRLGPK